MTAYMVLMPMILCVCPYNDHINSVTLCTVGHFVYGLVTLFTFIYSHCSFFLHCGVINLLHQRSEIMGADWHGRCVLGLTNVYHAR